MSDHYAVVGNPVNHSLSPRIHAEFARQTGQDMDYVRLPAPLDGFASTLSRFRAEGGRGVNVTLPFKLEAFQLASHASVRARGAQAANVLKFEGGEIVGDNTDGIGLVHDLQINQGRTIAGARVLLVGAGGAARGVLLPLLECRPELLVIANRTPAKADELCRLSSGVAACQSSDYAGLSRRTFDLIINATSAGIQGEAPDLPPDIFKSCDCAYDMMYGREPTAFIKAALACGAKQAVDGLGMLVEQAAESFLIWRGIRPRTAPVLQLLRQS